ncbi:hypothetical protein D3C83_329350 [compost metagenome]
MTDFTSAAVPVINISSAEYKSPLSRSLSITYPPFSSMIWITLSRVIPSKPPAESGGV